MKNNEQRFATLPAEELPPGWTPVTIGGMIDTDGVFTDGDWVVSKDQDPDGDVRLVQLADIGDGFWVNKSSRYLTYEKAIELGCTFLEPGDVLIARMPDPLGRACIFPGDSKRCITAVDVCIVRTGNQGINHRWLMHTINSPTIRVVIESLQSGSTRKRISRKNLGRIDFPLPPSPEQRRIVAEIETQFTRLDAAVAALERAQANIRRYKAAVLQAACEGRLVPTEAELACDAGRHYEPADHLLARILAERRAKWEAEHPGKRYKELAPPDTEDLPELPEGWTYALIEPLLSTTRPGMKTGPFGSLLKKHEHQPRGVPVLGIENIGSTGYVPGNKIFITEEKADQLSKYDVQPNDILISRSGTVGEVCIVPEGLGKARFSTNLMRIALEPNGMLPRFFRSLFDGCPLVLDQVSELCSGSTRDFLNQKILKSIVFPLPPLVEQRRIVAEVERRLSLVAALEASVEAALARAGRLRQAVLKQAFEGGLVPQDPDDEPASVLLERIRAEKAERQAEGKRTGNRKKPKAEESQQLRMF